MYRRLNGSFIVTSIQYDGFSTHSKRYWVNKFQKLARFRWFRRGYSLLKGLQQTSNPVGFDIPSNFFADVDITRCVRDIRRYSLASGLYLPNALVGEIIVFAQTQPCFEPDAGSGLFRLSDIQKGCLPKEGNRPVYCALVKNLERCDAVNQLANDPVLLHIARRYLNYYPETITTHLTWSIASDRPLEMSQANYPPSNFHYDIAGYNFMTMNFYITSVRSVHDGPHMMIEGTHRAKPWSFYLSGRHSDGKIDRYYGLNNVRTILGPAGYGFMEDPSCIHRVLPPKQDHRLIFQIRYS